MRLRLMGSSIRVLPAVRSMKLLPGSDAISVTMSRLTRYLRCTRKKRCGARRYSRYFTR